MFRSDNEKGAENICKELGYAGGTKYTAPGGSGPILAGNRFCSGGESTIWDCPLQAGSETEDCSHDIDQGVNCTGAPGTKRKCHLFYPFVCFSSLYPVVDMGTAGQSKPISVNS